MIEWVCAWWLVSAASVWLPSADRGADRDPLHEVVDDRLGQLAAGRHLVRLVLERRDEQAFVRFVGHDRRGLIRRLRAFARPCRVARPPWRILGVRRMAVVALLDEDRPDVGLEEFDAFWGSVGRTCLGVRRLRQALSRRGTRRAEFGDLWTCIGVGAPFATTIRRNCGGGGIVGGSGLSRSAVNKQAGDRRTVRVVDCTRVDRLCTLKTARL